MATPTASTKFSIPLLTEKNYSTWLIDVRAILRRGKLWPYTQYSYPEFKKIYEDVTESQWEENAMEAADTLVPTISTLIKQRLAETHFDNGYLLLSRLRELLQPVGDIQFMRLTRELYSLELGPDESPSELLTRLKLLEEQIDATKVELTHDKRTLLALTMALATDDRYRSLVQIWQTLPDMTAERARQMLLEEQQIQKANEETAVKVNYIRKNFSRNDSGANSKICGICEKQGHNKDECWEEHPELAPEWLQPRLYVKMAKRNGSNNNGGNNGGSGDRTKGPYDVM